MKQIFMDMTRQMLQAGVQQEEELVCKALPSLID